MGMIARAAEKKMSGADAWDRSRMIATGMNSRNHVTGFRRNVRNADFGCVSVA